MYSAKTGVGSGPSKGHSESKTELGGELLKSTEGRGTEERINADVVCDY